MRVAIVDDEPLARAGLRLRLEREPGVEIVGEAASGEAAVALVRERAPELLFLDVRMPGGDGFETLARIALEQLPLVVFVTAYDAHAVRAFEVNALDYLLKPVDEVRLAEALRRAREELARGDESRAAERVAGLLAGAEPGEAAPLTRFVVRERGRFRLVRESDVRWIAAAANYIEVHTATGSHLVRMTLAQAEARLPGFARIHRARLVRRALVTLVEPTPHGDFLVRLDDGSALPMSRRYRDALLGRP